MNGQNTRDVARSRGASDTKVQGKREAGKEG